MGRETVHTDVPPAVADSGLDDALKTTVYLEAVATRT